ncbi:hypothetical protein E2P81_ATG09076 [Venturia nashicola]|nr:hypothetical protein E2P81_ATG09076 [Venturia nashicola]
MEPIAIIGMGCRLPGATNSPSQLWEVLEQQKSAQTDFPANRLNVSAWYHPDSHRPGSVNAKGGYFLSDDDSFRNFDPQFFGISPLEAKTMDPQQRKLCETVYESLESAGARLEDVAGTNTACFIGNFTYDAAYMQWKDTEYVQPYQTTGVGATVLSNRISYVFDFKGPSFTIDTACSSTMYALHLACGALRNGECSGAIVGGTNLIFGIEQHIASVALGVLSPRSVCNTFDEAADGYGRADAVGAIYIKRLSDAIANQDPIRAIVRGTAINANGKGSGISHPSVSLQEQAIRAAYANAGLDIETTRYFECHGTGTKVGDPIEVEAVGNVFAPIRSVSEPLHIGAVKSNLGHGEAASSIASLIKTVLVLEKGLIPATVGIKKLNPALNLHGGALDVCQTLTRWPASSTYRRASVNSFGYGGANAHAVLDCAESYFEVRGFSLPRQITFPEAPINDSLRSTSTSTTSDPGRLHLLALSAHNQATLDNNIAALDSCLAGADLYHLAYTLASKRSNFNVRAFALLCARDVDSSEVGSHLKCRTKHHKGPVPTLAFAFTGQGAQWPRMGIQLMKAYPSFRTTLDILDQALATLSPPPSWSIVHVLHQASEKSSLHNVEQSQPICTAVQIALVDLLRSWDIVPSAVVGHSSGEIAASYCAGLTTAVEAIRIAYLRGLSAARKNKPGSMLAVGLGPEDAGKYLQNRSDVVIACYNSTESVTLSGLDSGIEAIRTQLNQNGVFNRVLKTSGNAYHSWLMSEAGADYESHLEQAVPDANGCAPSSVAVEQIPMFSTVSGSQVEGNFLPISYWRKNLESPVLFTKGLASMLEQIPSVDHVIEIGPHTALGQAIKDTNQGRDENLTPVTYLNTLKRGTNDTENLLNLAGELFLRRYAVNTTTLNAKQQPSASLKNQTISNEPAKHVIDLPPYSWAYGEMLWHETRLSTDVRFRSYPRHDLLGSKVAGSSEGAPSWRNILRLDDVPWIRDHKIAQNFVFPAAAYIAMALEAGFQAVGGTNLRSHSYFLEEFVIEFAMILQEQQSTEIITDLHAIPGTIERFSVTISTVNTGRWTKHASGFVTVGKQEHTHDVYSYAQHKGGRYGVNKESFGRLWLDAMQSAGIEYGPTFRPLNDIRASDIRSEASAELSLRTTDGMLTQESDYLVHPSALDGAFQLTIMAAHGGRPQLFTKPYIPTRITKLYIPPGNGTEKTSAASLRSRASLTGLRSAEGNATIADHNGALILNVLAEFMSLEGTSENEKELGAFHPYNRVVWKPDFDLLTRKQLDALIPYPEDLNTVRTHFDGLEELSNLILLNDGLTLEAADLDGKELAFHRQRFVQWVQKQGRLLRNTREGGLSVLEREDRIKEINSQLGEDVPEIALITRLHYRLEDIIYDKIGALDVMIEDGLLSRVYEEGFSGNGAYEKMKGVLEIIGHKEPNLKILELGAGSGGATKPALDALHSEASFPLYQDYTFTDVSTAFLSRAQTKFGASRNIRYSLLDIEKDIEAQGYEHNSFDIIIASNVIHATSNLVSTLKNCHKLLKAGGKLILIETIQIRFVTGLLVGQLPGYWLGVDDGRPDGPFVSGSEWNGRLLQSGFSGVDAILWDHPEPYNSTAVMMSHKIADKKTYANGSLVPHRETNPEPNGMNGNLRETSARENSVYLVYGHEAHPILKHLEQRYTEENIATHCIPLENVGRAIGDGCRIIMLAELEDPILSHMTQEHLDALKSLSQLSTTTIWVTNAGVLEGQVPEKTLVVGLVKSITIEEPAFRVATIDIDPQSSKLKRSAALIFDLEKKFHADPDTSGDVNYVEKDGVMFIGRNTIDEEENRSFESHSAVIPKPVPVRENLELGFQKVGDLSSFYFQPSSSTAIGPREVSINTWEFGFDRSAVEVLKGQKKKSKTAAIECMGQISQTGSQVTRFRPGDFVFSLHPGTMFNTTIQVVEDMCWPLDGSDTKILGQLLPFSSGLHILQNQCHLLPRQRVLLDLPGYDESYAIAQVAFHMGASVSVLCYSDRERHLFRDLNAVEIVGDDILQYSFDVVVTNKLSQFGTLRPDVCDLGRVVLFLEEKTAATDFKVLQGLVDQGIAITCVESLSTAKADARVVAEHTPEIFEMLQSKVWKPIPAKSFDISQFDEAATNISSTNGPHRAILRCHPGTILPTYAPPEPLTFRPDASYILVGCLGGLGRVITMWMISRGARHLIFLSRSAADKPEAAALVAELTELARTDCPGLVVDIVRGDVSRREDVSTAIAAAKFPIKGVVQAAMVLKDSLWNSMTLDVWNRVIHPKMLGTIHFHELLLGQDLDFFVLTSTILSVIGAATQSNYAAANAFLDHFARHRQNLGLQVASISIGMVVTVGHVEEHPESEAALRRNGMYGITMAEFMLNFERACRRRDLSVIKERFDPCSTSNIITGMDPSRISRVSGRGLWQRDARLRHFLHAIGSDRGETVKVGSQKSSNAAEELKVAAETGGKQGVRKKVQELVMAKLAGLVLVPLGDIESTSTLSSYGMDSMIGAELRSWLQREFHADVPFLALLDQNLTFVALSALVHELMVGSSKAEVSQT